MKKDTCSIVEVQWKDHSSTNNQWQRADSKAAGPVMVRSVGYVLRDESDYIVMADTLDDDPNARYSGSQRTILKSDITKVKVFVKNARV